MVLVAPPFTTKLFPKLHHNHYPKCASSCFYSKQMQVLQTKSSIFTSHNHRKRHTSFNMASENGREGRILMPGADVSRRKEVNFGSKMKEFDMVTAGAVVAMHLLCGFAPFTFNWGAVHVAIALDLVVRLLGINLSFHRHLSHKSFKVPKLLEYALAYCGTQALQGNPIDWVRTHRIHHQYVDSERDPHTPIKGFWFSHVIWMFDTSNISNMLAERNNVRDLEKQWFYRFIRRSYILHPIALAIMLYAFGGLSFLVWGMGVRIVWGYHMTWLVNSVCHGWGDQTWNTGDLSLNNRWVGMLAYGDGWHNNHHAFEYSARHGLEWWEIDITWYLISFLEKIGMATNVKLPTTTDIQRKTFALQTPSP